MIKVCRTCLQEITDLNFISLSDATSLTGTLKVRDVLTLCVPELAIDIISEPVMCEPCMNLLHVTYNFKQKCIRTEERIRAYIQSHLTKPKETPAPSISPNSNKNSTITSRSGIITSLLASDDDAGGETKPDIKQEPLFLDEEFILNTNNALLETPKDPVPAEVKTSPIPLQQNNHDSISNNTLPIASIISSNEPSKINPIQEPSENANRTFSHGNNTITLYKSAISDTDVIVDPEVSQMTDFKIIYTPLGKRYQCCRCEHIAKEEVNILTHFRVEHSIGKKFRCNFCEFQSLEFDELKCHLQTHSGRSVYACTFCDYATPVKILLTRHMKCEHNIQIVEPESEPIPDNPLFKCYKCEFTHMDELVVKEHSQTHYINTSRNKLVLTGKEKEFLGNTSKCERYNCNDGGSLLISALEGGSQTFKNITVFHCNKCDYKSFDEHVIKIHSQKHLLPPMPQNESLKTVEKEPPRKRTLYSCNDCTYQTSDETSIKQHILIHSNGGNYNDSSNLNQSTDEAGVLKKKKKTIFKCNKCLYLATEEAEIKRHVRKHVQNDLLASRTPILPKPAPKEGICLASFQCNDCSFKTPDESIIKRHIETHLSDYNIPTEVESEPIATEPIIEIREDQDSALDLEKLATSQDASTDSTEPPPLSLIPGKVIKKNEVLFICEKCQFIGSDEINFKEHVLLHTEADISSSQAEVDSSSANEIHAEQVSTTEDKQSSVDNEVVEENQVTSTESNEPEKVEEPANSETIDSTPTSKNPENKVESVPLKRSKRLFLIGVKTDLNRDENADAKGAPLQDGYEMGTDKKGRRNTYKCKLCPYTIKDWDYMQKHVMIHKTNKYSKCDICGYVSKVLYFHMKSHRKNLAEDKKEFKCTICNFSCESDVNLSSHMKTHSNKKVFKCENCEFVALTALRLKKHAESHLTPQTYACVFCNYTTTDKSVYFYHTQNHSDERSHKCNDCNFSSMRMAVLLTHQKSHVRQSAKRKESQSNSSGGTKKSKKKVTINK